MLQIFEEELPEIPQNTTFILSDATGQEIIRLSPQLKKLPSTIGKGIFRVSLLTPDGEIKPLGILIR